MNGVKVQVFMGVDFINPFSILLCTLCYLLHREKYAFCRKTTHIRLQKTAVTRDRTRISGQTVSSRHKHIILCAILWILENFNLRQ